MKINNSQYIFEDLSVNKALFKMAVPAIASQLIVLMYNLADTFFIGKANDPNMVAAVSLVLPVFNITIAFGSLFGVGGGSVLPKLLALNQRNEAEKVNMYCITRSLLLGFFFSLMIGLFLKPFFTLLGANDIILPYVRTYVTYVLIIGGIPTLLNNTLSNLLRSISLSKEASFGVAFGGILNILLDPLFMFYIFPEGNEVKGVAVATLISNLVSCAYLLYVLLKKQTELTVSLSIRGASKENIRDVYLIGIPGTVNTLLFDADYMVLNRLMSGYSSVALASIGIVLKAERLPIHIGIGLCQAVVPLISYSYAKGNDERVKEIIRTSLKAGILLSVAAISLYEVFPSQIIRFFIQDAETICLGAQFLRPRSLATLFMFLSFFVLHIFQAFGEGKTAFWLGVLRWALLNIPILFIMNYFFQMSGLPWGQLIADAIAVAVSFIILLQFLHKKK